MSASARSLCIIGIAAIACGAAAEQRWLESTEQNLRTDGKVTAFPLPNVEQRSNHDRARGGR